MGSARSSYHSREGGLVPGSHRASKSPDEYCILIGPQTGCIRAPQGYIMGFHEGFIRTSLGLATVTKKEGLSRARTGLSKATMNTAF